MDSLTVFYLARELHARWHRRRVIGCLMDQTSRTVLVAADGSPPVCIRLAQSLIRVEQSPLPEHAPPELLAGWSIHAVDAPPDDRRLVVHFEKMGKFRGSAAREATLEISFFPPSRGAVLREGGSHRLAVVGARLPAPREPRPLLTAEQLRAAAETRDERLLLEGRWVSPLVARWLLGDPATLGERYAWLCALPPAEPSRCGSELVPFPLCPDATPAPSLVHVGPEAIDATPTVLRSPRARAVDRLQAELERARSAPQLRAIADALAGLGEGASPHTIAIGDEPRTAVPRREGERAIDTAERLYREVRSMERALANLPARIAELQSARDVGGQSRDSEGRRPSRRVKSAPPPSPRRPYRTYRTTGGFEVWVGRGAASNEELTFKDSSPDDVWMHARGAAGAHVVLRWQQDDAPPAKDLEEAAALAAWHSKARGSSVVPVDWTRRRQVRRARGSPTGTVLVAQSKTIFARPSATLERRLRWVPDEQ